jgi:hypothetical protein
MFWRKKLETTVAAHLKWRGSHWGLAIKENRPVAKARQAGQYRHHPRSGSISRT